MFILLALGIPSPSNPSPHPSPRPILISSTIPNSTNGDINRDALEIIKSEEGFRSAAYWDVDSYAVGFGSKKGVHAGTTVSMKQAVAMLIRDVTLAKNQVREELSNIELNENQLGALTSLVYNTGLASIIPGSTIRRALDRGDYQAAANGFRLWVRADGAPLSGLIRRRGREIALFNKVESKRVSLRATTDTYIKFKPTSSILDLEVTEYTPIKKGEKIEGMLEGIVNSHYKIIMTGGNIKYVFIRHFTLP